MRKTVICLAVVLSAVVVPGCSSQPSQTPASSTTVKPAGGKPVETKEIASAFEEFSEELSAGCPGGSVGTACQDHIGALLVQADSIRLLMQGADNPKFYDEALKLIEKAGAAGARGTVTSQGDVLSTLNELHSWMLKHVPGASAPATRVTTTTTTPPQTPEAQLNALARDRGLTQGLTSEASDDVRQTCRVLTNPGQHLVMTLPQWLVDEVFPDTRRREWTELGIPMLCPEHVPVLEQAKSGDYERWYGDGKYVVGEEIPPGTYQISGKVTDCYWERSTKAGEIIDNNFAHVASDIRVTIKPSDGGFTSERCGVWKKVG